MRPVVGAVHDDRVVGDAELVELVEQLADVPVVVDHRVVVLRLPPSGLAAALGLVVGAEVHVRRVEPHEERRLRGVLAVDEVAGAVEELVVDRLHPLLRERAGVLDLLAAVGVAQQCSTPRGPKFFWKLGKSSRIG